MPGCAKNILGSVILSVALLSDVCWRYEFTWTSS